MVEPARANDSYNIGSIDMKNKVDTQINNIYRHKSVINAFHNIILLSLNGCFPEFGDYFIILKHFQYFHGKKMLILMTLALSGMVRGSKIHGNSPHRRKWASPVY